MVEQTIEKKKRGRKAHVVNFEKNDNANLSNIHDLDNEPIILQIPVTFETLEKSRWSIDTKISEILSEIPVRFNYNDRIIDKPEPVVTSQELVKKKTFEINDQMSIKISKITTLPSIINSKNINEVILQKTDICCWWDGHQFDTYPVYAPIRYSDKTEVFKVEGCFCSLNCASAYLLSKRKDNSLLILLAKKIVGKMEKIKRAPPKEILMKFGGSESIDDYRKSFTTAKSYYVNRCPLVYDPKQLEEHIHSNMLTKSIKNIENNKNISVSLSESKVEHSVNRTSLIQSQVTDKTNNSLFKLLKIKK